MYLCCMIKTELEFYTLLKEGIEKRIESKGDFSNLKEVSRATYYNIRNLCEGDNDSPRLSLSKIKKVCAELDIPFESLYFKLKSN